MKTYNEIKRESCYIRREPTNISLNKDMEMMKIYRYSRNRDNYVRFANLSRDSGDAYRTTGTLLVANRIKDFDKTYNQQKS